VKQDTVGTCHVFVYCIVYINLTSCVRSVCVLLCDVMLMVVSEITIMTMVVASYLVNNLQYKHFIFFQPCITVRIINTARSSPVWLVDIT